MSIGNLHARMEPEIKNKYSVHDPWDKIFVYIIVYIMGIARYRIAGYFCRVRFVGELHPPKIKPNQIKTVN